MKTVHMIGNAHLDPVWQWGRGEGIDAVLATARSACDRLDEYPQFIVTCSGAWFHRQIERHDAGLFGRVCAFVRAGRWQPVGGMVVQPDCNLPSEESFARQLAVGQEYYRRVFGRATTVGYNVDSFGHGAYLPRFLRRGGLDCYVFMRPGRHEKALPANLFRWRSPDGHEVLAARILGGYCPAQADLRKHVEFTLQHTPQDAPCALCFFGVGDHGGGPTRGQIEWILSCADDIPGARLVFSHPRAFFDAATGLAERLPVVEGELQHHAIGCYSVERPIKVAMRRAEARLVQAEQTLQILAAKAFGQDTGAAPAAEGGTAARTQETGAGAGAAPRKVLEEAWEGVLFNQFHDALGGTSLKDVNLSAAGQLQSAAAAGEEVIALATRRAFRDQAEPGRHKIVVLNPSDEPYCGYLEHEPWLQWAPWTGRGLVDEAGRPVPHQCIEPRGKMHGLTRLLFGLSVPARSSRVLGVVGGAGGAVPGSQAEGALASSALRADEKGLVSPHLEVETRGEAIGLGLWSIYLEVYDDPSDTHAHSCGSRFSPERAGGFAWRGDWEAAENGPLRAAVRRAAGFDCSRLWCRLAATAEETFLRVRLSLVWAQARQRLVLRVRAPHTLRRRLDLVSGGPLPRALDGLEYPLGGGMIVGAGGENLGIIAPEVFSASADGDGVMLTLLRSPYVAHHDPMDARERPDHAVTDQGSSEFDLLFWPGCPMDHAVPARLAREMLAPPVVWDLSG